MPKKSGMMPQGKPSDADRLHQKANPATHEKSFGGMASGDPMSMGGMSRESQKSMKPKTGMDGLGKMMSGMGGKRSDMTIPNKPPTQKPGNR